MAERVPALVARHFCGDAAEHRLAAMAAPLQTLSLGARKAAVNAAAQIQS